MLALVIDDSKAMRIIIKGILRQAGFEVLEAVDGQEGLEKLREAGMVDLAVVDWHMPRMDGCAFVRAVRADLAYQEIPLLMVTSETDLELVSTALQAGANEYVMKPFTRDAIVQKLQMMGLAVPQS